MTETPQPTPPPNRRWVKIVLVVSLALNLAVLGVVAGGLIARHRAMDAPPMIDRALAPLGLRLYARAMDAEDRRAVIDAARDRRADLAAGRSALRGHFAALAGALRAEPFDPAAVAAVLADQRRAAGRQLALGQDILVDRIAAMPRERRLDFAARIEAALDRRR